MAANEMNTWHVDEFASVVDHIAQQEGSVLRMGMGVQERMVGKRHAFEQLEASAAQIVNTRFADSPHVDVDHQRRWVDASNIEWGRLIDNIDLVRTLVDPTNPYTQNAGWAVGREIDEIIITAFDATVSTGETASGTQAFDTTNNVVDSSGTNGMTVAKLREANRILRSGNVNPQRDGQFFCAMTARQFDDLLSTTEVTSMDFNNVKALVNGDIDTFMGFKFLHTELLNTDSNSDRECFAWASTGMALAVSKEPMAQIDPARADKRFIPYVFYSAVVGAVRLQEKKVVKIVCDES